MSEYKYKTKAIRACTTGTPEQEHSNPIFLTSSYLFDNAQQAQDRFTGEEEGNVYSRYTNPTIKILQDRLALLDGAEDCMATASGMAAIYAVFASFLQQGDHVLMAEDIFGSTISLANNYLKKFGVEVDYISLDSSPKQWQKAMLPNTKLVFLESPSNPLCKIADLQMLSSIVHKGGAKLVVDNAFCTSAIQRPLEYGVDLLVYTTTKFIDGQGRCVGGAVVGRANDIELVRTFIRTTGACMSAFDAWVFIKGLETLDLRMREHCMQAQIIAEWLDKHSKIEMVYYAGLKQHPNHELAKIQQNNHFGGVLSFEIKGGKKEAWKFIDSLKLLSITANLGDVKTTVTHPATTTHVRLTQEARDRAGIKDSLVRICVGLEDISDIQADIEQALLA